MESLSEAQSLGEFSASKHFGVHYESNYEEAMEKFDSLTVENLPFALTFKVFTESSLGRDKIYETFLFRYYFLI